MRAEAQVDGHAAADSNFAETGNPFIVHLSVPTHAGQPLDPDFSAWDSVMPQANILAQTNWTQDGPQMVKDLTLIAFDADTLLLPALPIPLQSGRTALTNPLEIIVLATPSPDDPLDMSDIKDIRREPTLWSDYLPWAIGIGALILLVLLGFWLAGRANRRRGATSRSIELPPHELALKKLDVLAQKQLWQQGLVKDYYAQLTFILREYLQKRFQVPALESTTETILQQLTGTVFPQPLLTDLQEILLQADLAKFAKAIPPPSFHEPALHHARQIVLATVPPPEPLVGPNAGVETNRSTNQPSP